MSAIVQLNKPPQGPHPTLDKMTVGNCTRIDLVRPDLEVREILRQAFEAQKALCDHIQQLANQPRSIAQITKLHLAIKDLIPSAEGRIRAISIADLSALFSTGHLPSGMDFAPLRNEARVGHEARYIFVQCKASSSVAFKGGAAGSSEINTSPIPLADLVLYIPLLKDGARKQAAA